MRAKSLTAIAAISLIAAGSGAAAQSLSLVNSPAARARVAASGQNSLDRRGYGIYVVGAVVLGLIVWGIVELTNNDHDMPASP